MEWQLQQAKMRLSEVVKRATGEGPQTLTVHGKRTAVILSAKDYDALIRKKPTFTEFLLSGPRWPDDVLNTINDRPRDVPRDHEF
jgi:prevent-host-death family protein